MTSKLNKEVAIERTTEQKEFTLKGIKYIIKQLNNFSPLHKKYENKRNEFEKNSQEYNEYTYLCNCMLESSIYNIRRLYEFFFAIECICNNCINQFVGDYTSDRRKCEMIAECYFNNIEEWKNIKRRNNLNYSDLDKVHSKQFIDKKAMHITITRKEDLKWNIIPIIGIFDNVSKIFLKSINKY